MTTPKQVNKHLLKIGIDGEIIRDSSGYYYFTGEMFDIVPSLFIFNLKGETIESIVNHIKKYIKIA